MGYTVSEANAKLATITTESGLRDLISQLDVNASGSVTLLYSGGITAGTEAKDIIGSMLDNGDDIRVLDKTYASDFLSFRNNPLFEAKLQEIFKSSPREVGSAANKFLFGTIEDIDGQPVRTSTGAWDIVSKNFIDATTGEVRTITPIANTGGVFFATELPAVLANPSITHINGFDKADINRMVQDLAATSTDPTIINKMVFDLVNDQSRISLGDINLTLDSNGNIVNSGTKSYFSNIGLSNIGTELPNSSAVSVTAAELASKSINPAVLEASTYNALRANDFMQEFAAERLTAATAANDVQAISKYSKYLNKLGAVGSILGLTLVSTQANAALQSGDPDGAAKAQKILEDYAADSAGAWVAGGAASIAAAPLLALGPAGWAAYGLITIGASIVGGEFGVSVKDKLVGTATSASEIILPPDTVPDDGTIIINAQTEKTTKFSNGVTVTELRATNPQNSNFLDFNIITIELDTGGRQVIQNYVNERIDGEITGTTIEYDAGNNVVYREERRSNASGTGTKVIAFDSTGNQIATRVQQIVNGDLVDVSFTTYPDGSSEVSNVNSINGEEVAFNDDIIEELNESGLTPEQLSNAETSEEVANIIEINDPTQPSGFKTLVKGIETYSPAIIDALSIVQAVQNGQPLPAFSSTLKLANNLNKLQGITDYELSATSNVVSGVLSVMSLNNAIKQGDNLAIASSVGQLVGYSAQAYVDFAGAAYEGAAKDVAGFLNGTPADAATGAEATPGALAYLSIVNSIARGDTTGAAIGVISLSIPAVGFAYQIYNIVSGLLADGPPDPWGTGQYVWDGGRNAAGGSTLSVTAAGESGGSQAVQGVMDAVVSTLNSIIERERQQNPGAQLGLIPTRMPRVGYGLSGYTYTNIDPLTGVEKNPGLRFDTSGRPINAEPGSPESFQSLIEGMVLSALKRGAIAPLWEVETARLQSDAGDPKAGLTEEARAGRDGQLAAALTGDTQFFRPVSLDLDGDGIETIIKENSSVYFDVDDSGFLKKTAWIGADDAFLTIDRNYNGTLDSGRELFSNGKVALGRRGLAGMGWVDANYDGKITSADPVWNEINVWQDANSNGAQDAGESQSLSDLGITELNYSLGTFTQNGVVKQLGSPDLTADTEGTRTSVVEEGIIIESSNGNISLLVSRIDDKTLLEPNRDGITGFEDIEIIVNSADLLANDTLGGFTGRDLTITGVSSFVNGTGFLDANGYVHFNPSPNYAGGGAQFKYNVLASNGQTGTSTVDVTVQNVNDAPTLDSVERTTRPIYGYTRVQTDWEDNNEYLSGGEPIYSPYVVLRDYYDDDYTYISYNPSDFSSRDVVQDHTRPIENKDTGAGQVIGKDIDDPVSSLTYSVSNQPQYGSVVVNADGTYQYTGWKEPGIASDDIKYNGEYGAIKNGTLYTGSNLPSSAVNPTYDVFQITITDPQGATTTENITVPHYGPYLPPTPPGGGGKKPITIDLDGDGFEFVNVDDSNVFFDVNGDGWKQRTSWVGADDGLLAYDINGDGKIDQSGEISFTQYKDGAQSDIEGLTAFDSNGDGIFSAADDKWSSFGIWQDANQNGITDEGELRSLNEMGVASIGLTTDGQFQIISGQTVNGVGSVDMQDGSELAFADVALSYSSETAIPQQDGTVEVVNSSPFSPNGEEIHGTADDDLILGKNGNNIVYGYEGDDVIFEDGGNDVIDSGAGNDLVYAGKDNDLVMAQEGDDVVYAGLGDDLVFAGDGDDAVLAEGGNDVVFGGDGNDFISGGFGNDVLSGDDGNDQLYGESGNDALFGRDGNDQLAGMDGYDYLNGGAGNDLLDGGAAADEMIGGAGNDTYGVDDIDDTVTEFADEGTDTVKSSINYTLGDNVENLTLKGSTDLNGTGNELNNSLKGNEGNNILSGAAGDDVLNGGEGVDTLIGGTGDDTYIVDNSADTVIEQANEGNDLIFSSASYVMPEHVENMILTGTSSISGTGNALDNRITGNNANNLIDGGAGADVMAGGKGHDNYIVDNTGDVVLENQNQGIDTVNASIDYALGENLENVTLTGSDNLNATGNELDNVLTGNSGNNVLDGGTGVDTMTGGAGDDTYIVDNINDTVTESIDEGVDLVNSSVTYTASDNVENLTLTGSDVIDATGNNLNNTLTGNDADNVLTGLAGNDTLIGNGGDDLLDGGTGIDTMAGGLGNDTYVVDDTNDVITEAFNEGIDHVDASATYTLSDNLESLTLTGTADINATGNNLDNTIQGNSGANLIDGGTGADSMSGAAGDDTYIVDNAGDTVTELADEGTDSIDSSVSYVLPEHVENLTLTGADAINATGNNLNNTLTGNDANNVLTGLAGNDTLIGNGGDDLLDGGTGIDTMAGGLGNDTYIVDDTNDVITEAFNEGIDHVDASATYTLSDNLESLTLTGTADINATGNNLDNTIQGNSGANLIDGGTGADSMSGAAGDDTYMVDNDNDLVTEFSDEGTDTVNSSVSYVLPEHVENLKLVGNASINGWGNSADNILTGNSGDNIISGGAGNDIISGLAGNDRLYGDEGNDTLSGGTGNDLLEGGTGNDQLDGGEGDDTYVINLNDGLDTITDISGTDTIRFGEGLSLDNVAMRIVKIDGDFIAQMRVLDANGSEQPNQGFNYIVSHKEMNDDEEHHSENNDDRKHKNDHHNVFDDKKQDFNVEHNSENFVSPIELFEFADGSVASFDDMLIKTVFFDNKRNKHGDDDADRDEHHDKKNGKDHHHNSNEREITTARNDDVIFAGSRAELINSGTGNDTVFAASGDDTINGGGGNDVLLGESGDDIIYGGYGIDILSGGKGEDTLIDIAGNSALLGGNKDDVIIAGLGNDFIAGGRDDDTISTGLGHNVVAYNEKDGRDTVIATQGATNTLSIGGGIELDDLALSRYGDDLILDTGYDDGHKNKYKNKGKFSTPKNSITFKDWYASEQNQNFVNLQIINEKLASKIHDDHDHKTKSPETLTTNYDFTALVKQFDEAQLASVSPSSWSLMNGALDAHLGNSDTEAMGGDLAVNYADNAKLHMSASLMQQTLSSTNFGGQVQAVGQKLNTDVTTIHLG